MPILPNLKAPRGSSEPRYRHLLGRFRRLSERTNECDYNWNLGTPCITRLPRRNLRQPGPWGIVIQFFGNTLAEVFMMVATGRKVIGIRSCNDDKFPCRSVLRLEVPSSLDLKVFLQRLCYHSQRWGGYIAHSEETESCLWSCLSWPNDSDEVSFQESFWPSCHYHIIPTEFQSRSRRHLPTKRWKWSWRNWPQA